MAVKGAPKLEDVKAWLGIDPADTQDDVTLQESLNAALEAQSKVVRYPRGTFGESVFSADLRDAIFLRTQRLAARRNSPEGVVGLSGVGGDFVGARLPGTDADVLALEGPYRLIVVA